MCASFTDKRLHIATYTSFYESKGAKSTWSKWQSGKCSDVLTKVVAICCSRNFDEVSCRHAWKHEKRMKILIIGHKMMFNHVNSYEKTKTFSPKFEISWNSTKFSLHYKRRKFNEIHYLTDNTGNNSLFVGGAGIAFESKRKYENLRGIFFWEHFLSVYLFQQ